MTRPRVVGHRGWPARYPDNTLGGFLAAATVADAVETDIRRCGDGRLVLSHDTEIAGLVVSATAWPVLDELDLGDGHHPALLDEAMAAVPGTPFQLEVKNLRQEAGFEPDHRVGLEAAERARPGDLVTSFNWATLAAVRQVFPDVATGLLAGDSEALERAIDECRRVGHRVLLPRADWPTPGLERALDHGLELYPWVVNDSDRAAELADLGVSGIITDDPPTIRSAVQGGL